MVAEMKSHRRAVLRRDMKQMIGGDEAAGPRHPPIDDVGISRNMPAEMVCDGARVDAVAAAARITEDQVDRLAAVEVRDRLRACGGRCEQDHESGGDQSGKGNLPRLGMRLLSSADRSP